MRRVQLHVITWREDEFGLYDYRSEPHEDIQFHSNIYNFPFPIRNPVYYFIHQATSRNLRQPFMFECRKDFASKPEEVVKKGYKLIGGFKLESRREGGRERVYVTAICQQDIPLVGGLKSTSDALPFWVVRSFGKWVVRERQVIKFGKLQLVVDQDATRISDRREELERGEVLNLDEKAEESQLTSKMSDGEGVRKQCRVCYDSEEEGKNILVNPCHCRGSVEYIHIDCLRQWLQSRLTRVSLETGGAIKITNKNCCELCKMRFPTRIIKNGKEMALISYLERDNPYICFSPLAIDQLSELDRFYVSFGEEHQVRIGRLEESGLYLADQTVSRRHAVLRVERGGQGCTLEDEESKYGTLAYQEGLEVRLSQSIRAFQINNTAFCFSCSR